MAKGLRGGKAANIRIPKPVAAFTDMVMTVNGIAKGVPRQGEDIYDMLKPWKQRDFLTGQGSWKRDYLKGDYTIERETEKAFLVSVEGPKRSKIAEWIPKSALKTDADNEAGRQRRRSRKERYDNLVKFAKDNKVPGVRNRMKAQTILDKIRKAGLDYKY